MAALAMMVTDAIPAPYTLHFTLQEVNVDSQKL
jgi:hypothetical protein